MPTRVYTHSSGSPAVTPTTWAFAIQINPVSVPGTLQQNTGAAMTAKSEATGTTSPTARAMGRTILGPLAAQTISGTVKGQMRGAEDNIGANATLALAIKIVQPNGADRGVLLAQTASDSATAGNELVLTTLTNAQFKNVAESASLTLTSQAAQAGDYLVIEWGFRSATTTSRTITLSYGNDSATDLPEDTSTTTAQNPWWEFSGTIGLLRSLTAQLSATSVTPVADGLNAFPRVAAPAGANHGYLFPAQDTVRIHGAIHGLGTERLHVGLYDTQTPRHAVLPDTVTIDPVTFDVVVSFVQAQAGLLVLNAGAPAAGLTGNYRAAFGPTQTLTIPGATHQLATPTLLGVLYDASTPGEQVMAGSMTVDPADFTVVFSFAQAQSGVVVLCGYTGSGGTLNSAVPLPGTTSVSIPQATHGITSAALLVSVYDSSSPRRRVRPGQVTVDASTQAVTLTFAQAQAGTAVLNGSTQQAAPRLLVASVQGSSTTPASVSATLRPLVASIQGSSTTPASLSTTLRLLAASVQGNSATPASLSPMLRVLGASAPALSATPVTTVATERRVTAHVPGYSATPEAAVVTTALRALTGVLSGTSSTPASLLTTLRALTGVLPGASSTPASLLTTLRQLVGILRAASLTPTAAGFATALTRVTTPVGANHGYLFPAMQQVVVPGLVHGLGTPNLLVGLYDAQSPHHRIEASTVTIDPSTLDVLITFGAARDGLVVLNAGWPPAGVTGNYATLFGPTQTLTIPGTTHQLATPTLLGVVYDTATPRAEVQPQSFTIDPVTFTVVLTFGADQSGLLVLCGYHGTGGTPNVAVTLPGTTSVSIPQATHGFATEQLFVAIYDASTPRALVEPSQVTVHPTTHEVVLTFGAGQTGRVVLNGSVQVLGGTLRPLTASVVGGSHTPAATPLVLQRVVTPVGANHGYLFPPTERVVIAGSVHGFGTPNLLVGLYDAATPRARLQAGTVTIDPATFAVEVLFNFAQAGMVVLNAAAPSPGLAGNYVAAFGPTQVLTIPGAVHQLATPTLLGVVYDTATPAAEVQPQSFTVHPTTHEVVLTFGTTQSGTVVLCGATGTGGTPNVAMALPGTTAVAIPQATHGLDTPGILVAIYDANTPRALVEPSRVTVHPTTHEVLVTFGAGQAGTVVLNGSLQVSAVLRSLTAAIAGLSVTPLSAVTVQRPLAALVAGSTATRATAVVLTALRALTANVPGRSATAVADVVVTRRVTATPAAASATAESLVTAQRLLLTQAAGRSTTRATAVVLTALRALTAHSHGASTTPSSVVAVTRALTATVRGASTTVESLASVQRPLLAQTAGRSTTRAASAVVTALRALSASLQGQTATPPSLSTTTRRLGTQTAAVSTTPVVLLTTQRPLLAQAAGTSSTRAAAVVLTALRELTATLGGATATPLSVVTTQRRLLTQAVGLGVTAASALTTTRLLLAQVGGMSAAKGVARTTARQLLSQAGGTSTTPAVTITTPRTLSASLQGATATALSLVTTTRRLLTQALGLSTTAEIQPTTPRPLLAQIGAVSRSRDAAVVLTGLRAVTANLEGRTSTTLAVVTTARHLVGAALGLSASTEIIPTTQRRLLAQVTGVSALPLELQASLARALTTSILGASVTPTDTSPVHERLLRAEALGSALTPAVTITTARRLTSAVGGASRTEVSASAVERPLVASVPAATTTRSASVVVSGLRALTGHVHGASTTPARIVTHQRSLLSAVLGATATPLVQGQTQRPLVASLVAASTTPAAGQSNSIVWQSQIGAASATPAIVVALTRDLQASPHAVSVTPLAMVAQVRDLQSAVVGSSVTPASTGAVLRRLSSQCQASSLTEASVHALARELAALVQGQTQTAVFMVTTARDFVAQVEGCSAIPELLWIPFSGAMVCRASLVGASVTSDASLRVLPRQRIGHAGPRARIGRAGPRRRTTSVS